MRAQVVASNQEAAFDELFVTLEPTVFVLDRKDEVVADGVERRDEPVPPHLAETGPRRTSWGA